MTKDPARSLKAVLLPRVMAPSALVRRPVKRVAGIGQLSFSLTRLKKWGNGAALSRARAQYVRPTVRNVPIRQGVKERKMINSNPNVAPLLPVA